MLFKLSLLFLSITSIAISSSTDGDDDARCMAWAIKRLTGVEDVTTQIAMNRTMNERDFPRGAPARDVGPVRYGKRGPAGPVGPRGPAGPPGICDCIPDEVRTLERENIDLKEKIERIRQTSPETFCLLGMKAGTIPYSSIRVSTNTGAKSYSRLDGTSSGWYPSTNNIGHEWIMVDLGKIRPVTGVVTQGRYNSGYWTKQYQVEHSRNGVNFTDVKKADGSEMVFSANTDQHTKVVNRFPNPVNTRFVRIYPMAYHNGIYIRFDVIDC